MNAFVIDAFEYCRLKERREGDIAVSDLARLAEESVDKTGVLHWSLQGGADSAGRPQLMLSVSGTVRLRCQRCLSPFVFVIKSESSLILARDEESADEIDAALSDDEIEVIVGSKAFNVAELIEEEALLAIPFAPKHEICPDHAALDELRAAEKPSPFHVLKDLKR
jgi:uncharacterized protein